jgi:hypothetical protein
MTLLRRSPREIYRVYSEQEYLCGAGAGLAFDVERLAEESPRAAAREHRGGAEHRLRRVVAVAMLAATVGTFGGLVCLNLTRADRGNRAGQRGWLAARSPTRVQGSSPVSADENARPQVESSWPAIVGQIATSRTHVAPLRRSRERERAAGRSHRLLARPPLPRHAGVAVLADYPSRRFSPGEATAASGSGADQAPTSAPVSTPPVAAAPTPQGPASSPAVATAPVPPASHKRAEFGFER